MVPPDDWWPVSEFVQFVKDNDPDFQRPAGDYDSWYIRDASTGEYRGFESWDRVDGALLWFILTGPMYWLGLTDLGDEGALCRLTAYGRALVGAADWPDPPGTGAYHDPARRHRSSWRAPSAAMTVFSLRASRNGVPPEIRTSTISRRPACNAAAQGIPERHARVLRRASGRELPPSIIQLIDQWERGAGAAAQILRAAVLRVPAEETMRFVTETPELRRYLGASLGPTAAIVRPGQEQNLAAALQSHGILVEFDES